VFKVGFLSRGDAPDSFRVEWKLPELRERLMILVIVGIRTEEHSLRSQVGIGSESDCLFGQLDRILDISDSVAGLKVEKSGGVTLGEGECGETGVELLSRERRSLEILSVKKEAKLSASELAEVKVGKGEEDLRCKRLLTVCQRRRGLADDEETSWE